DRGLRRRLAAELGPELAWIRGGRRYGQVLFRPLAEIRCEAMIATGGDPYPLHAGDAAGPFGGCSLTAELVAGPLAVVLEPRVAYDPVGGGNAPAGPIALGGSAVLDMPRGYAKLAGANLELAGGVGGLAWSTGRSGLIWSGNAADPLMVRFTQPRLWQLPWIFRYLGDFRATLLWAHLLGPREDVDRPYTLGMKIDWRPVVPWLEISLSRLAMYGGEGRPDATAVDIWQLIWATHPHADYDEDKNLFDANEIAAIEATLQVPFAHLIPGVRFLQLYWTNAGEDTIRTYLGPLPLPGLTGAANLGGFYLGVGPLTLRLEWARLMDDRFRWYTHHRIYHQGFVHHGRITGHPIGGDAEETYVELGLDVGGSIEGWIWLTRSRHEGVVDVRDDVVYTLAADLIRTSVGAQLRADLVAVPLPHRPRLQAQLRFQLEHHRNAGYVP
ncbi:MAG: capsule assembly Wzi family protein, partial [Myxococcota bacterium]|nr:capsule assembly Wzi family protein [Myxococcota bacterium]